jgi:hypothetical protein
MINAFASGRTPGSSSSVARHHRAPRRQGRSARCARVRRISPAPARHALWRSRDAYQASTPRTRQAPRAVRRSPPRTRHWQGLTVRRLSAGGRRIRNSPSHPRAREESGRARDTMRVGDVLAILMRNIERGRARIHRMAQASQLRFLLGPIANRRPADRASSARPGASTFRRQSSARSPIT